MADNDLTIALIGRPNCGKTTLFNALTGDNRWVGNWPGVTVEGVHGAYCHNGRRVVVVDLPGAYTLTGTRSLDEEITAEFLAAGHYDLVINVTDADTPERSLYLTAQVLESQGHLRGDHPTTGRGKPMLVALNRMDRAEGHGLTIDSEAMARTLGCPVVPISAARGDGIEELKDIILTMADGASPPAFPEYAPSVIAGLNSLARQSDARSRWSAIRALEDGDDEANYAEATALGAARHALAAAVVQAGITRPQAAQKRRLWGDRLDRLFLSPWLGVLAFLVSMYLMFLWTIHVGGAFVDAFDGVAGALVEVGFAGVLTEWGFPGWIVLLVQGFGSGLRTMAAFMPLVFFLYIFLSFLEESGYMSRAAVVMDRFMRRIGLPGNAFVPLVVGLGCNVPAVMAARTLEDPEDRMATIAMTPFMSCSARLPVYVLFAATFFPNSGQNMVFALYLIGFGVAVFTAYILKRTLFQTSSPPLLLELPSYQWPNMGAVTRRAWTRTTHFAVDAGKVVIPLVVVLTVLNSVTLEGTISTEKPQDSLLAQVGQTMTPILAPIGVQEGNWQATVGLLSGLLAKEAVVGTLVALYSGPEEDEAKSVPTLLQEALQTIPDKLSQLLDHLFDPLDVAGATEEAMTGENESTMSGLREGFATVGGAFAYLVFVLLYAPCVATIAAIRREAGGVWTLFVIGWATTMGYVCATLVYQTITFLEDPLRAGLWIMAALGLAAAGIAGLRWSKLRDTLQNGAPPIQNRKGSSCGHCS